MGDLKRAQQRDKQTNTWYKCFDMYLEKSLVGSYDSKKSLLVALNRFFFTEDAKTRRFCMKTGISKRYEHDRVAIFGIFCHLYYIYDLIVYFFGQRKY
jgi:hypothetical protein